MPKLLQRFLRSTWGGRLTKILASTALTLGIGEFSARYFLPNRQDIFIWQDSKTLVPNPEHWLMIDENRKSAFTLFKEQKIVDNGKPKVVFLGGSTLNGWGYHVPPIDVTEKLSRLAGDEETEYVNLSVPGLGLRFASRISEELDEKTDSGRMHYTWVLASAHNETLGHVKAEIGTPRDSHPYEFGHKTRIPSKLVDLIINAFSTTSLKRHPRPSDQQVLSHANECIDAITGMVRRRNERLILCTLASNLRDCPPKQFSFSPHISPETEHAYLDARLLAMKEYVNHDWSRAEASFRRAINITREATGIFWLARTLERQKRYSEASQLYEEAKDLDIVSDNPRAPTVLLNLLRKYAATHKIQLLDIEKETQTLTSSITGLPLPPGHELFLDNCHPNKEFLIHMGEMFFKALTDTSYPQFTLPGLQEMKEKFSFRDFEAHTGTTCWYLSLRQTKSARNYFEGVFTADINKTHQMELLNICLLTQEYDWFQIVPNINRLLETNSVGHLFAVANTDFIIKQIHSATEIRENPSGIFGAPCPSMPSELHGTLCFDVPANTTITLDEQKVKTSETQTLNFGYHNIQMKLGQITQKQKIFQGPQPIIIPGLELKIAAQLANTNFRYTSPDGTTMILEDQYQRLRLIDETPVTYQQFTTLFPQKPCQNVNGYAKITLQDGLQYLTQIHKRPMTFKEIITHNKPQPHNPLDDLPKTPFTQLAHLMQDSNQRTFNLPHQTLQPTTDHNEFVQEGDRYFTLRIIPNIQPFYRIANGTKDPTKTKETGLIRGALDIENVPTE